MNKHNVTMDYTSNYRGRLIKNSLTVVEVDASFVSQALVLPCTYWQCFCKLLHVEKLFPQSLHWKRFSCRCVNKCASYSSSSQKYALHVSQLNRFCLKSCRSTPSSFTTPAFSAYSSIFTSVPCAVFLKSRKAVTVARHLSHSDRGPFVFSPCKNTG